MFAKHLANLCVVLPVIAVHASLAIALALGNLDLCVPYWSHCHSISSTGRQYPEFFVFKALMIPTAVVMLMYWYLLRYWMIRLTRCDSGKTIYYLGSTAALALIIYTVTLGAVGEPFALARRMGVVLYFGLTALAHLLLLAKLKSRISVDSHLFSNYQALLKLCFGLLVVGVGSAFVGFFWPNYANWENAFEWWFALLMMGQFYLVGQMWSKTGYTITLSVNDRI